ncbi:MAG: hypothetical protein FGM24_06485 [Candidatus Kapabacteria bacterium]|nr:hypothetical protein [Candidatus Kapabacteria bacterium]
MATSTTTSNKASDGSRPSFFGVRALALTAAMLVGYWLLISVEIDRVNPYQPFYENRISFYYSKIDTFSRITSLSQRMTLRHSYDYTVPKLVSERLRQGDVLLLPPAAYAEQVTRGNKVVWTDPRIFTYMVGRMPMVAWDDTARRSVANTAILLELNTFEIIRRGDAPQRYDSVVAAYAAATSGGPR